jgi:hypothetical protein
MVVGDRVTAPRCYPFWICTICRWFVIVGSTYIGRALAMVPCCQKSLHTKFLTVRIGASPP